jgi:hypothetical protein
MGVINTDLYNVNNIILINITSSNFYYNIHKIVISATNMNNSKLFYYLKLITYYYMNIPHLLRQVVITNAPVKKLIINSDTLAEEAN